MSRNGVDGAVARRWFWSLLAVAMLAMSALYRSLTADPGPAAGLAVLVSALLVAATTTQAARIWLALTHLGPQRRDAGPRDRVARRVGRARGPAGHP